MHVLYYNVQVNRKYQSQSCQDSKKLQNSTYSSLVHVACSHYPATIYKVVLIYVFISYNMKPNF